MKCPYKELKCIHFDKNTEDCAINTCYDEYDVIEEKPFPSEEVKKYWEDMK